MPKRKQKYYFDQAAADHAVNFIERFCTHVKGDLAGTPIVLEDWQKDDIVNPLFGTKRKEDGLRRYRAGYFQLPRKNAKTTLVAAICLYMLFADGEKGAEIYCAAADRNQASILFDISANMVKQNKRLTNASDVFRRSITKGSSSFKVLSSEASSKHGFNASCVIVDELHAQKNRELVDTLETSLGARSQPLFLMITTAGYDKQSLCYTKYDYAKKVEAGLIKDDTFLSVIYEADEADDPFDPATWDKANPGLGTIVRMDYIRRMAERAKNEPSFYNTFLRLHLNIWTSSEKRWLTPQQWDACDFSLATLEDLEGHECHVGIDLASTRDLSSMGLLFPDYEGKHILHVFFWCPQDRIMERTRNENINYSAWERAGLIKGTPGDFQDTDYIIDFFLEEVLEQFDVRSLEIDRWGSNSVAGRLANEGVPVKLCGQGYASLSEPSKQLEKFVLGKMIDHAGNPVLAWQMSNVMIVTDPAENIKPDKSKSTDRIDGIYATIMAIRGYLESLADDEGDSILLTGDY